MMTAKQRFLPHLLSNVTSVLKASFSVPAAYSHERGETRLHVDVLYKVLKKKRRGKRKGRPRLISIPREVEIEIEHTAAASERETKHPRASEKKRMHVYASHGHVIFVGLG